MKGPLVSFSGADAPAEEDLYKCVHCGFCLQACPTYVETGLETESPRGRIALMKAVNEGRIGITPNVVRHWDLCIQCRACEVACPSGVPYGRLIEATMSQVGRLRRPGPLPRLAAWLSLRQLVPHQRRLELAVSALGLYQRLGVQKIVKRSGVLRVVSGYLDELNNSLPRIPRRAFRARGQVIPPRGERRARVALLSGCVMPLVNGPAMEAVTRVLARNGCEVIVPRGQVCCGALHSHVGDLDTARALARRNIDVFLDSGVDAVVVASAGCGVRMKEYGDLLDGDPSYAQTARNFDALVKDVHEFLAALPLDPPRAGLSYRVTYQDSCHLSHAQRITEEPRALLRAVSGLELVEMDSPSRCCGAGGTYTLTQRDFSTRLLDHKMRDILATDAEVVATANPGCVMQLIYGVARSGARLQVRYVTDILDEAYRLEQAGAGAPDPAEHRTVGLATPS